MEERLFAILTSEISKATFGMTPGEYRKFKGLTKENLGDHMNDLELIFTMLGERVSTEITRKEDAQGFPKVEDAAKRGGKREKRHGAGIGQSDHFKRELPHRAGEEEKVSA